MGDHGAELEICFFSYRGLRTTSCPTLVFLHRSGKEEFEGRGDGARPKGSGGWRRERRLSSRKVTPSSSFHLETWTLLEADLEQLGALHRCCSTKS